MRLLVTGASGFIGFRLAHDLARDGHSVTGTWRQNPVGLRSCGNDHGLRFVQLDASDRAAVNALFEGKEFDAVVHCAARLQAATDRGELPAIVTDNVLAQANLIDSARATGCRRFISCSSISVYGEQDAPEGGYRESDAAPDSLYGWSKRAAEQILDLAAASNGEMRALSLRLAGVHGAGRQSGALHRMTVAALAGDPILVAEPESRFRWLFIDDLVKAVRSALTTIFPCGHKVLNLASADVFTLAALADRIRLRTKSSSRIELHKAKEPRNKVMNIEQAKSILGFSPEPLDACLRRYLDSLATTT